MSQQSWRRELRRILRRRARFMRAGAVLCVATGAGTIGWAAMNASASTVNGVAMISSPDLSTSLVGQSLASSTKFGVKLPAGAACSGDTLNGGYQVVSYMVPPSVFGTNGAGLSALTYSGLGVPNDGFAYITPAPAGTFPAFAPASTVPTTGVIQNNGPFGPFQWGPDGFGPDTATADFPTSGTQNSTFNAVLIPPGQQSQVYETGIACIKNTKVTDFWNAEITFKTSTSDPNGYTWTPTATSGSTTTTTTTTAAQSTTTTTVAATTSTSTSSTTSTTSTSSTSTTSTIVPCDISATTSSSTSTTPSSTSTSSTSSTSTAAPTTTTVATIPCTTSSTTAALSAGPTGGDVQAGSLPFTGSDVVVKVMVGVVLLVVGLVLSAAARQRQEVERLLWPDER